MLEASPDFDVAGIVRRQGAKEKPLELERYDVVSDIAELHDVDVAILALPTRECPTYAKRYLAMGINTVNNFELFIAISLSFSCYHIFNLA